VCTCVIFVVKLLGQLVLWRPGAGKRKKEIERRE
jgi:hypothetical protein